jgi:hypothetical protein
VSQTEILAGLKSYASEHPLLPLFFSAGSLIVSLLTLLYASRRDRHEEAPENRGRERHEMDLDSNQADAETAAGSTSFWDRARPILDIRGDNGGSWRRFIVGWPPTGAVVRDEPDARLSDTAAWWIKAMLAEQGLFYEAVAEGRLPRGDWIYETDEEPTYRRRIRTDQGLLTADRTGERIHVCLDDLYAFRRREECSRCGTRAQDLIGRNRAHLQQRVKQGLIRLPRLL